MKIEKVWAREVLDSRGNPTVEAEVTVGGRRVTAIAPSGASTGTWEALELRDGDKTRFGGKGVLKAVENVRGPIARALVGMDPADQEAADRAMIELDGTDNKSSLGGNATVAASLAVLRAGACAEGVEVYRHAGAGSVLPVPMFNIINGGKHAGGDLRIQECMVIPAGAGSFSECLRMSSEIYASLKGILKKRYGAGAINIGDEGGFAPPLDTVDEALGTICAAVSDAGYTPGRDAFLAIDAASSEFYSDGVYDVDAMRLTAGELEDHYVELTRSHPLISIEDPFFEDDFETTAELTRKVGGRVQIVGDDLFVTNSRRLAEGIRLGAANALLLKVNQIGTVTEAREAAEASRRAGYNVVVSHRSGETEDTTIADIAVGWGSGEIKTGAPARGERTAKYNRLLRIEEELGSEAEFPGLSKFRLRGPPMALFSSTEEQIRAGDTMDVYFGRTKRILEAKGLADVPVWAEFTGGSLPLDWEWGVFCGLQEVLNLVEGMPVDVYAVPEGTVFRPRTPKSVRVPLMNVHGSYSAFGEMETAMLGMLCQPSGIATQAARTKIAARWKQVFAFGNRRMHPAISGVIDRSAYIGGCDAVSSRVGGEVTGTTPVGTVPHALMLMMGSNDAAFRAFDEIIEPEVPRIMLIDTYSDERTAALEACRSVEDLKGVRLDTPGSRRGNFKELVNEVRWELDMYGYGDVDIIVSGGLNETTVADLADTCVSGFGVGTSISNAPTLDLSMDLVERDGVPISKRGKFGGRKYAYRCPRCFEMGVSLSPDDEVVCSCGERMEMIERKVLDAGRKVEPDRDPSEIRDSVMRQIRQVSELRAGFGLKRGIPARSFPLRLDI